MTLTTAVVTTRAYCHLTLKLNDGTGIWQSAVCKLQNCSTAVVQFTTVVQFTALL